MSFTRKDIRQRIGGSGFCGDMLLSTASTNGGGGGATLVDTTMVQPDDFFNYGELLVLTGTSAGNLRKVADWAQSTGTFTPDRVFGSVISSGVSYEVHRLFSATDKNNAINEALRAAGSRWTYHLIDTGSLVLDADDYRYSLDVLGTAPDPVLQIDRIEYDPGGTGDYPWVEIHPSYWRIDQDDDSGFLVLNFEPTTYLRDGADTRIYFRLRPPVLSADTDVLTPDDATLYNYVCAKATAILFRGRARVEPEGSWDERAKEFDALADGYFDVERPDRPPKAMRSWIPWG